MADQLYLSLWFPNFRLENLPNALSSVMQQLAQLSAVSEGKRVHAAAVYPISFSESPLYQRVYVNDARSEEDADSVIEIAVAEATEQLHDDLAYEFEMKWRLWLPDTATLDVAPEAQLDAVWRPTPSTIKIIGFGSEFDSSAFEQNGHIRVDFGLDYPWVLDDEDDDPDPNDEDDEPSNLLSFESAPRHGASKPEAEAAQYIQRNIELLLAFTLSVEKNCGISARLLWTESGEPLAEKLIARLQRLN